MADISLLNKFKQSYIQKLIEDGEVVRANIISKKDSSEAFYTGYSVNPEEEPNEKEIKDTNMDISLDISALDYEISSAAEKYNELIKLVINRLQEVQDIINIEKERIQDINMICGLLNDFNSVEKITASEIASGSYSMINNVFTAKEIESVDQELRVIGLSGNGYEGNYYVLSEEKDEDNRYIYDVTQRDAYTIANITDGNDSTSFEYSRLTSSMLPEIRPKEVNLDNIEAKCSITLYCENYINHLKIKSQQQNIKVTGIETSSDGVRYAFAMNQNDKIKINSQTEQYDNDEYAYGSGIITFPSTQFVRVSFESDGATDETVGFEHPVTGDDGKTYTDQILLPSVNRHCISIDNISSSLMEYKPATFKTKNLISTPVKSIAIFANEYFPPYYADKASIKYTLTVNDKNYDIIPVNSMHAGIKIIKNSAVSVIDTYAKHIDEEIKSAYLTVSITSKDNVSTPYISNLKVCTGV